jgi:hypothetical protein
VSIAATVLDCTDEAGSLTIARLTLTIVGDSVLAWTLLLAAKGWCIIRDSLSVPDAVKSVVVSVALITFMFLMTERARYGSAILALAVLSLVSFGLFVLEMIRSVNQASMHIMAHRMAMGNAGIAPQTTPLYRKHRLDHIFSYSVVF